MLILTTRAREGILPTRKSSTGVVLASADHDKSNDANNTAVVLRHILKLSSAFSEMTEKMQEAHERTEERLQVVHADMQHLQDRLEQHLMQHIPPPATSATPRPIAGLIEKYKELPPEDIDCTGLRSIPEILQNTMDGRQPGCPGGETSPQSTHWG